MGGTYAGYVNLKESEVESYQRSANNVFIFTNILAEKSQKDPIWKAEIITLMGIFTEIASIFWISQTDRCNWFYKGYPVVIEMAYGPQEMNFMLHLTP